MTDFLTTQESAGRAHVQLLQPLSTRFCLLHGGAAGNARKVGGSCSVPGESPDLTAQDLTSDNAFPKGER